MYWNLLEIEVPSLGSKVLDVYAMALILVMSVARLNCYDQVNVLGQL